MIDYLRVRPHQGPGLIQSAGETYGLPAVVKVQKWVGDNAALLLGACALVLFKSPQNVIVKASALALAVSALVLAKLPWINPKDAVWLSVAALATPARFPALCVTLPLFAGFISQMILAKRSVAVQTADVNVNGIPGDAWRHVFTYIAQNKQPLDRAALVPARSTCRAFYQLIRLDARAKDHLCEAAARANNFPLLRWAHEQDSAWNREVCAQAALHGNLEMLQWARVHGCPWDEKTLVNAAYKGHMALFQWAAPRNRNRDSCMIAAAAGGGYLDVVRWAHENGFPWDASACNRAAEEGHLEVLQYLHARGCPMDFRTACFAARGGHLEILQWAVANGSGMNWRTFTQAAFGPIIKEFQLEKTLAVLSWLKEQRCTIDQRAFLNALRHSNIPLLQWLKDNGCPWNAETFARAGELGKLDVLKWLKANGCPWDLRVKANLHMCGHLEQYQWAIQEGM